MTHKPPEICPMFGNRCRHCSIEKVSGAVTLLKTDIHSGMLVRKAESFNVMELGAWCNNDGRRWVADMHYCPAGWNSAKRGVQPVWNVRKDTAPDARQEIVLVGQQVLEI